MANLEIAGYWRTAPEIALRVRPGFKLVDADLDSKPGWTAGQSKAEKFIASRGKLLAELQERFFAMARAGDERKFLVITQGMDTSGKGGVARHILGMVDPQGVHIHGFGGPTKEELSHHFLWRIKKALPPAGKIGYFDRSHYEDVLIARVDHLAPIEEIEKRYDEILQFEQELIDDGYVLLKFALMHTYEEQCRRLAERLTRPDKFWKYDPSDVDTRRKWDQYYEAHQIMFDRTSTEAAPWYVIPANYKWYARLAAAEMITQALIRMDLDWPVPEWDLSTERVRLVETMHAEKLPEAIDELKKLKKKVAEVREELAEHEAEIREVAKVSLLDAGDRI
ncbi:MAG: polyphosphate kinase 2 family protein [Actinomycetaceae bacterium]|nr:polyphosphate kinase 2 family protein [Actinomycetaceae bacterium]